MTEKYAPVIASEANGSRECAPDDRLRNPVRPQKDSGLLRRFRSSQWRTL